MSYKIIKPELKKEVKGVLFDLDGVILDTEKLYNLFWREALAKMGYEMSFEEALGLRSLNRVRTTEYLNRLFNTTVDYERAHSLRILLMEDYINKNGVELKKGIIELLDYLNSNNIPCAITTSSPLPRVRKYLAYHGIENKFNYLCSAHDVEHGKPAPDIYLYGAKCINVEPSSCIAIEDSKTGMISAFSAHTMSVIVPDLDEPEEETLDNAFSRADSLLDIIDIIEEINK